MDIRTWEVAMQVGSERHSVVSVNQSASPSTEARDSALLRTTYPTTSSSEARAAVLRKAALEVLRDEKFTMSLDGGGHRIPVMARVVCLEYMLLPTLVWAGLRDVEFSAAFERRAWGPISPLMGYQITVEAADVDFQRARARIQPDTSIDLDPMIDAFFDAEAGYTAPKPSYSRYWRTYLATGMVMKAISLGFPLDSTVGSASAPD